MCIPLICACMNDVVRHCAGMAEEDTKTRFYLHFMGQNPDMGADEESLLSMAAPMRAETVRAGFMTEIALKNLHWEYEKFSRYMDVFEDEFLAQYCDELRGYIRRRVKGCSGQLTKDRVIEVLKDLNKTHKNWWMRNDYKVRFWERLRQMFPDCCDGVVSEKLRWDQEAAGNHERPERNEYLVPSKRQQVYLNYFGVGLPAWANQGDASAFIEQIIADTRLEEKQQKWQKERFRLYPDLYADKIQAGKFPYIGSFRRYVRRKVKGADGNLTKNKIDHILSLMDERDPGWFFSMYMEDPELEERNHREMFDLLKETYPECVYSKGDTRIPTPLPPKPKPRSDQWGSKNDGWSPTPKTAIRSRSQEQSGCGSILLLIVVFCLLSFVK